MDKIFAPKGFVSGDSGESKDVKGVVSGQKDDKPKTFTLDGIEFSSNHWKRTGSAFWLLSFGLIFGAAAFEFFYWLASNLNIHYFLVSLMALIFSVFAIKTWDAITGKAPSLFAGPITFVIVILFVFSIFIGYQHKRGISVGNLDHIILTTQSWTGRANSKISHTNNTSEDFLFKPDNKDANYELGEISGRGKVWRTIKNFDKGDIVKVRVSGGSVGLINGVVLETGLYSIPMLSDGTLAFKNVKNTLTKVKVTY